MSPTELGPVADDLIDQYDRVSGPLLVRLERHRNTGELIVGVRPVDGHPADALERFRAPSSWIAIGLVCGGWAAPMDGIRPSAHPDAVRVTQVVLVDRDGNVEGRVRYPDRSIMREPPGAGIVLDALRAALDPRRAA